MHFDDVKEEAGVSGQIGLSAGFFLCHMLVILSTTHFFPIEEDFFCGEKIWYMRGSHWEWGWAVVQDLLTCTYIVTSSLKFVTFVGIASWKYTLLASTYQPGGGGGGGRWVGC